MRLKYERYEDHMLELSTWTFVWAMAYTLYPSSMYRPYALAVFCFFGAAMLSIAGRGSLNAYLYHLILHFAPVAMCLAHRGGHASDGLGWQVLLAIVWFIVTNRKDLHHTSVAHYYAIMQDDSNAPCVARYDDDEAEATSPK